MHNDGTGQLWLEILAEVRKDISEPVYESAYKKATVHVDENGTVTLNFPDPYMLHIASSEGTKCIEEAFSRRLGKPVQLKLLSDPVVKEPRPSYVPPPIDTTDLIEKINRNKETLQYKRADDYSMVPGESGRIDSLRLNPRYTFRQFVVGNHCQLAHAAAVAVAREPGEVYNPLFIYALTGLGKTHLLQAIGHEALQTRPDARVCYVTSEAFTNELIDGIQHRERMSKFHRKYRNVDLLLIDDIHFLIGKPQTQEAFFHTFNTLHELSRQVVITSDRPPAELDTLEERLISRFEWGLTVDMSKPDYETRLAILQAKNQIRGFGLSQEILSRIASRVDSNIRELEGALTKMSAYHRLNHTSLTIEEVDEVLTHMRRNLNKGGTPMPQDIIEEVAAHFRISVEELRGDRRTAKITVPRQLGMYFCRELTHLSLKDIGKAFGGKDHTTVIYAVTRVEERLGVDEAFARDAMILRARLRERFRRPDEGTHI